MNPKILSVALFALFAFPLQSFAQCVNGVCQMRTPVRSTIQNIIETQPVRSSIQHVIQAQPIRSTFEAVRPANWRVFSGSLGCSGSVRDTSCTAAVRVSSTCSEFQRHSPSCSGGASYSSSPVYVENSQPYTYSLPNSVVGEVSSMGIASVEVSSVAGFRSDRVAFRRALKKATQNQVAEGKLTKAQAALLNGLSFFPSRADAMMAAIHDAAIDEGLATTQAIDWDGLIGFIERLMPIILQLIELFGSLESMLDKVQYIVSLSPESCFVALKDGSALVLSV